MEITKKMLDAMANAVREGRNDDVIVEKAGLTPSKDEKRLKKIVSSVDGAKYSKTLGLAHWHGLFGLGYLGKVFYYAVLIVDRFGSRTVYAIPATKADAITALPECPLSETDLRKLLTLAEQISEGWRGKIIGEMEVDEPQTEAKSDRPTYRQHDLVRLFEDHPEYIVPFHAMLDEQLRVNLKRNLGPDSIYNFVAADTAAADGLTNVLSSMLLSGEFVAETFTGDDAIELCQQDRAVILYAQEADAVEKLAQALDARERQRKECAADVQLLKTLPLVVSAAPVDSTRVVNIRLDGSLKLLSDTEMNLLKQALTRCMTPEFWRKVYEIWLSEMASIRANLWTPVELWRQILTCSVQVEVCPAECDQLDMAFAGAYELLWEPEDVIQE